MTDRSDNSAMAGSTSDRTFKLCNALITARQRLSENDEYVGEKETRTRVIIIDGILWHLGWDVADPKLVQMELGSNGSTIDYVLIGKEREFLGVVEAKRSKEALNSGHRRQASGYAVELGARFAVLTNGARWEAWEMNPGRARKDTVIVEVNITTGDLSNIAVEMMRIHRRHLLAM